MNHTVGCSPFWFGLLASGGVKVLGIIAQVHTPIEYWSIWLVRSSSMSEGCDEATNQRAPPKFSMQLVFVVFFSISCHIICWLGVEHQSQKFPTHPPSYKGACGVGRFSCPVAA